MPEADQEQGASSSSSSSSSSTVAAEGAKKRTYNEWLSDKVDEVAKREMMEAIDVDSKRVKLNDDVKGIIADNLSVKPLIKP